MTYAKRWASAHRFLYQNAKIASLQSKKTLREKVGFIFEKVLDFHSLMWYVVVLTEKAVPFHKPFRLVFCSFVKRAMARKHHSASERGS